MKTKYALMNDDNTIIAIFNNLADAEEMYLDLLEEDGYEHCYRYISRDGFREDLEDYYSPYRFYHNRNVFKTLEGAYLYMISNATFPMYHIEEVPYFED